MYRPQDLVRRAAANVSNTVSSTVSSVASVAHGKNRRTSNSIDHRRNDFNTEFITEESILMNSKDKLSLQLKLTPNKDAVTTTKFAIKKGYLLKKNEQGQWQRRYVCTVPHTFMYYFESETSESPRGVIDLELLTNITTTEEGQLKVATAMEELRTFYFDSDDREEMGDWMVSLMCNRYQEQQSQLLSLQEKLNESTVERKVEMDMLKRKGESDLLSLRSEMTSILQSALVLLGITEEELEQLKDINKMGKAVKAGIFKIKSHLEQKNNELAQIYASENERLQYELKALMQEIESLREAGEREEKQWLRDKTEYDQRLKESLCQMEGLQMSLQVALRAKSSSDSRLSSLSEQKRVLVREVKAIRASLQREIDANDQLRAMNEQLCAAAVSLQEQLNRSILSSLLSGTEPTEDSAATAGAGREAGGEEGGGGISFSKENSPSEEDQVEREGTGGGGPQVVLSIAADALNQILLKNAALMSSEAARDGVVGSNGGSADDLSSSSNRLPLSTSSSVNAFELDDAERAQSSSVDQSSGVLGSRSEELPAVRLGKKSSQRGLLSDFLEGEISAEVSEGGDHVLGSPQHSSSGTGGSSFFNGAFSLLTPLTVTAEQATPSSHSHSGTTGTGSGAAASSALGSPGSSSSSFGLLSSIFSTSSSSTSSKVSREREKEKEHHKEHHEEESGRLPSAMRLTCLRCSGSVEGPKYSTCKCQVPALSPQDLQQSHSSGGVISSVAGGMTSVAGGVFSGSSYVAGGIAGGFMKATAVTSHSMGGLFSSHVHSAANGIEEQPLPSSHIIGAGKSLADNEDLGKDIEVTKPNLSISNSD